MCTVEKRGNVFILTLTDDGEHRLNPTLLDQIQSALRRIRDESTCSPSSSALITTAEGKFFSNGYDLAWSQSSFSRLELMDAKLRSVMGDLISLPMPTIEAVSGHASGAGFIFALGHDYILMRKDTGFLYLSEGDIGLVISAWFMAMVKSKIGASEACRDAVLRATKFTAAKALEGGFVNSIHDGAEETVKAAIRLAAELVARKWKGHVYAQNRMVMLADALDKIGVRSTSTSRM